MKKNLLLSMILLISVDCLASENINILESVAVAGTAGISGLVAYKSTRDIFDMGQFIKNLEDLGENHKLHACNNMIKKASDYSVTADSCALISLISIGLSYGEKHGDVFLILAILYGPVSVPFCIAGHQCLNNAKRLADEAPSVMNDHDLEMQSIHNHDEKDEEVISMTNLLLQPQID